MLAIALDFNLSIVSITSSVLNEYPSPLIFFVINEHFSAENLILASLHAIKINFHLVSSAS